MRVVVVVRLSETVEELAGDAVIVLFRSVEVVFCTEGGLVVVFKVSWKIEEERDADAVIVALGASRLFDRVEF